MSDIAQGSDLPGTEDPTRRFGRDVQDIEPPIGNDKEQQEAVTPAAEEADAKKRKTEPGKDAVTDTEEEHAADEQPEDMPDARTRKPRTDASGEALRRQELLKTKQARVAVSQERGEKEQERFEAAKQKLIIGVRETRTRVQRLRESYTRQGRKTEEDYGKDARDLVEKQARRFEASDMELVVKKLLKRITIPHAETTAAKFTYLVGLGMNRDLPGGKMKYWSRENYVHLFAQKAGKKMEDILDEERHMYEAQYDELDEALTELEKETAPEEETTVDAAA